MTTSTPTTDHPIKHAPVCVPKCVPCVSRKAPGAPRECVSACPPSNPPLGGHEDTHNEHPASVSPMCVPNPSDNGHNTWLLTPRCRPAWIAILDLLDDGHWHPEHDVHQVMRDTSDLAPSTISNQLRQAGRRRWIHQRRGRIRLRDRAAFESALDATEDQR